MKFLAAGCSLQNLFEGIAALIRSTVCGKIYDVAGSYDIPFYVAGAFFLLAGFFSLVAQLVHRKKINKKWEWEENFIIK